MSLKNVVIIGAGSAGASIARELAKSPKFPSDTHRIVVVERYQFAYWPLGALRASVVPGYEDKVINPVNKIFSAAAPGSKHIVVSGVAVVGLDQDAVRLAEPTAEFPDATIPFVHAVLSTGSVYNFPARPKSSTIAAAKADLKKLQADVKQATSIVILGGGPVGVEFAGEVLAVHPDKKITLVTKADKLIASHNNAKLHQKLHAQFAKTKNAKVLLNDAVELPSGTPTAELLSSPTTLTTSRGTSIQTDLIINAIGTHALATLAAEADAQAVDEKGFVRTKPDLHVHSDKLAKYVALGDVNDVKGGKTFMNSDAQLPTAVASVLLAILPTEAAQKIKAKPLAAPPNVICVPFGPKGGATQLPFATVGEWVTAMVKGKSLFISKFDELYGL